MSIPSLILKAGREQSVIKFHPWIFSGAIAKAEARSGDIVDIFDSRKTWLARGYYHQKNTIACRILTRRQEETIDEAWLFSRLRDRKSVV